jgi:hypothetical protein
LGKSHRATSPRLWAQRPSHFTSEIPVFHAGLSPISIAAPRSCYQQMPGYF